MLTNDWQIKTYEAGAGIFHTSRRQTMWLLFQGDIFMCRKFLVARDFKGLIRSPRKKFTGPMTLSHRIKPSLETNTALNLSNSRNPVDKSCSYILHKGIVRKIIVLFNYAYLSDDSKSNIADRNFSMVERSQWLEQFVTNISVQVDAILQKVVVYV